MTLRIAGPARHDIAKILDWSAGTFGAGARRRYELLLGRAALAIAATDPISSKDAPELGIGIRLYHLRGSRREGDRRVPVGRPRHFLVYRRESPNLVVLLRVLHDTTDLPSRFIDSGRVD